MVRAKQSEDELPSLGDKNLADYHPPMAQLEIPDFLADYGQQVQLLQMGSDGDDIGKLTKVKVRVDGNGDPERTLAQLAPHDMLDSGHGFVVRSADPAPKTEWATDCEVCGDPILPSAGEWICEFGEPMMDCQCNACLYWGMWLRGEYRPRGGRPAKRCGTAECNRKAARERQRKSRAARKARGVTETP